MAKNTKETSLEQEVETVEVETSEVVTAPQVEEKVVVTAVATTEAKEITEGTATLKAPVKTKEAPSTAEAPLTKVNVGDVVHFLDNVSETYTVLSVRTVQVATIASPDGSVKSNVACDVLAK